MKLILINIHLLSLAVALGSMLVAEHLISERVIFVRTKRFTMDVYDTVLFASHTVTVALVLLWLSGIGFVVLGYLDDPAYIENQKIWAKVSIVFVMSLNGVYIHRALLPRLLQVSQGSALIRDAWESVRFRLSFCASIAGWLLAAFYGTAKFLNNGYQYAELFGLYLAIVAVLFALSYLVRPEKGALQASAATEAETGY
jgi:hypothetical protein